MGKKVKIGKQRKDKFYQLAKETGFRSRAAFKLLQLNRKYEFLQRSRVLVDLCAAPGGWLQVASQNMPVSSIIIGVDLVPIKPIHNVTTIQEDITTAKCRQMLKKELQTWKADCILNDGAPNVGKNWLHDAFTQAQLTLSALKLATEFLNKGGWFVSKMFRSKDYNAMLWVFQQFFKKVYATKPQASRNESAEIFVVCQGYLAPDKIDPKFLDPKHVFAELDMEPPVKKLDLGNPDKTKKKPHGYPEGDYTLYHKLPVSQFIQGKSHLEMLNNCNEIAFDDDVISNHPLTTAEIKECCKDIKVLGRKEFRIILNWRKNLKKLLYGENEDGEKSEKVVEVEEEEEDEEEKIQKEVQELQLAEVKEVKLKKKKVLKVRRKLRDKMNLKMILPNDEPVVSQDMSLFQLATIENKKQLEEEEEKELADLDGLLQGDDDDVKVRLPKYYAYDPDEPISDDYEDDDDGNSDVSSDAKSIGSLESYGEENENDGDSDENKQTSRELTDENPLLLDLDNASIEEKNQRKMEMWFGKEAFAGLEEDDDDELNIKVKSQADGIAKSKKSVNGKGAKVQVEVSKSSLVDNTKAVDSDSDSSSDSSEDNSSDDDSDYDIDNVMSCETRPKDKKAIHDAKKDGFETVPQTKLGKRHRTLDCEGLALGTLMIQSRKKKRDILDLGWNRYTNNDENLPDWFVKDEEKHYRKQLPVTKEMVDEYRDRLREINARPVKKIAEAKSRKKRRSVKKLDKARKRAEHVVDSLDMTDKEKQQQIKAIYKRAGVGVKPKKEVTYVVSKRGLAGKRVSRPNGVTGRFKVVDPRMKKDEMKRKSIEKKVKSKKLPKSKLTQLKKKIANNGRGKSTRLARK